MDNLKNIVLMIYLINVLLNNINQILNWQLFIIFNYVLQNQIHQ